MPRLKTTTTLAVAAVGIALSSAAARADEGMWTLDNLPKAAIQKAYGFTPDPAWVEKVQRASVRLAGGCSGSFVSPEGLVMTNHHCITDCISELSTADSDLMKNGFLASGRAEEKRCAGMEVNQLQAITDVTAEVEKATAGKTGAAFNEARRAATAEIEKTCSGGDAAVRCDVVTLYQGGRYHLYRYVRYQDVRLAFAPEYGIAAFGGDPDNFNFPRYCLDMALLRVYGADGKPIASPQHFAWSKDGADAGELVFVTGHPGATNRLDTIAELGATRDIVAPANNIYLSELRGRLIEFGRRGEEEARIATDTLAGVENGLKVWRGRAQALNDPTFFRAKVAAEEDLRGAIAADPKLRAMVGDAYDRIEVAAETYRALWPRSVVLENGRGFNSDLFRFARQLVRAAEEREKPNAQRLREYGDARLPALKQRLSNPAPIHESLEIATLSFGLEKLREQFGPDNALVRRVLGRRSPLQAAEELVRNTRLDEPEFRMALYEGGRKAVDASTDPMIALAKLVDPEARAVRKRMEEEVDSVIEEAQARIARARFALYGENIYPDATFSLRLSYGAVQGWEEPDGTKVDPFTTFKGLFARDTGAAPFDLPPTWEAAQARVNPAVQFNAVTTNDVIGGNSGSPAIDREGRVVGLVFDGNIHSLAGDYGYDPRRNRTVIVDVRGMTEALRSVYKAEHLLKELGL